MITNRKVRWTVALIGVLICAMVYGLLVADAQSANEMYVESSTCQGAGIKWNDVPVDHIPGYHGTVQLYCPWQSYTWSGPTYLLNEGRDFYYYADPISWADMPRSGSNWGDCLITGYLNYTINSISYRKYITYPTGYDGYLDCDLKKLPMIMHYGPRLYQMYDPYPGPMDGMMMLLDSQDVLIDNVFTVETLDNPYP